MHKYWRSVALVALALTFVIGLVPGSAVAALAGVTVGQTTKVSIPKVKAAGDRGAYSYGGSMSDDGRYVVFTSTSPNLVPADTNGQIDVFRYDRTTKTTAIVSVTTSETPTNATSDQPFISGDGRYVVFRSYASNLNDAGSGNQHIYVRDMVAGTTTLVDRATGANGVIGNDTAGWPTISDDGSKVAFETSSSNLSTDDGDSDTDVMVRDLTNGTTSLVAVESTGTVSEAPSQQAAISGDGNYVVFMSPDPTLVSDTTFQQWRLFRKNISTGELILAARDAQGAPDNFINAGVRVSVSDNGRYVAWASYGALTAATDTNEYSDIYVRDIQAGTVELASPNAAGTNTGNNQSTWPLISGNGRSVLFYSAATDLVADDTYRTDMFVRNLDTDSTLRVSWAADGTEPNQNVPEPPNQVSAYSGIADDGSYAAFESYASNLLDRDTITGSNVMVAKTSGTSGVGVFDSAVWIYEDWAAPGEQPELSDNLRYVVFRSDEQLVAEDNNNRKDVYRFDRTTGDLVLVSVHLTTDTSDDGDSGEDRAVVSADGRYVVYPSESSDIIEGDTNSKKDIFMRDMVTGTTTRLNEGREADGDWWQATYEASHVSMTPDARYIVFQTRSDLTSATAGANWGSGNRGYAQALMIDRQGDTDRSNDTIEIVSRGATGWLSAEQGTPEGVTMPQISENGKWMLLQSKARLDQDAYAITSYPNIYLKSLVTTEIVRVSSSWSPEDNGGLPDAEANQAVVSADGEYVAFHTDGAENIVENDSNDENDVFLWSHATGKTIAISHNAEGDTANDESSHPSISADGRYVMYHSWATDIDADATPDMNRWNQTKEIYLYDVAADKNMIVDGIDGWSQQVSFIAHADGTAGVAYAGSEVRESDCDGVYVTTLSVPPTATPPVAAVLKKIGGNKFLGDSSKLTLLAQRDLRTAARTIKAKGYKTVAVRGYTSRFGDGSSSARLKLSTLRAKNAKTYLAAQLKKLGVSGVSITYKGYGANNPVATNLTFKGRQKNRRVEVWAK